MYIVFSFASARAEKQKSSHAALVFWGGDMSWVGSGVIFAGLDLVDRRFWRVRCKCPFIVAVDVGRYFCTTRSVNWGIPSNWSFLIAFKRDDFGDRWFFLFLFSYQKLHLCVALVIHVYFWIALNL